MQFIILALLLGFLFNLFLSKIDNPHGIKLMIIWGLVSVLSAILSISWTLSLNDIKNLHSIIGLGVVPYLMLISSWIFVMPVLYFKYKVTVKTNRKDNKIQLNYIQNDSNRVNSIKDILDYNHYKKLKTIVIVDKYLIIGYIEEGYAYMDSIKEKNLFKGCSNLDKYINEFKKISDFVFSKVYIAQSNGYYVAIYCDNLNIKIDKLQTIIFHESSLLQ